MKKRTIKNWILPIILAIIVAFGLNQKVFAFAKLSTNLNNTYTKNSRVLITKFNKDNIKINDFILYNHDNTNKIRKVIKVNPSTITITDKNKNIEVSKENIKGKIYCKIF